MSKRKKAARKEATGAFVESLEPRVLLSDVTLTTVGTTLLIQPTLHDASVTFSLSQNATGAVVVNAPGGVTNNAKTLVTGTTAGTIQNITILTGTGDDLVTILGPITNIKNFNANLGRGDNQLFNQGNVNASGSITINGTAAVAASNAANAIELETRTVVTPATVTTTTDTFNQVAVGATGSVSLLGMAAAAAKGTITIPAINGSTAVGTVSFGGAAVAAGSSITITDGFTGGFTETFVAGNANDVPGAGNNQTLHFNTNGQTIAQSMVNFAGVVNATRVAVGANFNISVAATADPKSDVVTNNNLSSLDNGNLLVVNAAGTTSGVTATPMSGGANAAAPNDTVTINDGTNPVVTFKLLANGSALADVPASNIYTFNLGAGATKTADTLDSGLVGLRQAIARANLAGKLTITAAAVVTPGAVDPSSYIVLTNATAGKAGNQPILFSNAQAFASPTGGMVDGTAAFAAGETITVFDGGLLNAAGVADLPVTFNVQAAGAPITDATTQFDIVAGNAIGTLNNFRTAIIAAQAAGKMFMTPAGGGAVAFNVVGATLSMQVNSAAAIVANPLNAGLMAAVDTFAFTPVSNTSNQWSSLVALDNVGTKTGGLQAFAGGVNSQTVTKGDTVTISDGTTTKVFEAVGVNPATLPTGTNIAFNDTWSGSTSPADSLAAAINSAFTDIGASVNNTLGVLSLSALATGPGGITTNTSSLPADITAGGIAAGSVVTTVVTQNFGLNAGDRLIIGNDVFLASASPSVGKVFQIGATTLITAANLVAAINGDATLGVTAVANTTGVPVGNLTPTTITITANTPGAAGNVTGSATGGLNNTVFGGGFTGLSGGTDASNLLSGDSFTISDGTTTKTLTATTGTVVPGVTFAVGATPALTAANLVAAITTAFATGTTILATPAGDLTGTGQSFTVTVANNVAPAIGAAGNQNITTTAPFGRALTDNMSGGSLGGFATKNDFVVSVSGDDDNIINLLNVTVGGNLLIQANTGGGQADGWGGTQVALDGVTVTGQTKVNTGAGVDTLAIDNSMTTNASTFGGIVQVNLGLSADNLLIDQAQVATTFNKSATFLTGGGADILQDATQVVYKKASGNTFKFTGVAGQHALLNALGTSLVTASSTVVKPTATNVNG